MKRLAAVSVALGLGGLLAVAAAAEDRWVHLEVEEARGTSLTVSLPYGLVERVVRLIPDHHHRGFLVWHRHRFEPGDLREILEVSRSAPAGEWETVRIGRHRLRVSRVDDELVIERLPRRRWEEEVEVRMPIAVAEALVSGRRRHFDLEAGLRAMARRGEGGEILVSDEDGETWVRLWVERRSGEE